ncbi:histone-lysine N-methyltransferase ash1 [Arctopsyche grandis]|uniref:histone-lysine N-methyltransferase ash1 n=1 Tax=Arctopsyche grandis TaxID=121162 RepID=UPI00406DA0D0
MGAEPATQSSSGESDSNSSDSENSLSSNSNSDSDSSSSNGSDEKLKTQNETRKSQPKLQQQFSVTSSETGLRLKIAAIPRVSKTAKKPSPKKKIPVPTAAAKKGNFEVLRSSERIQLETDKSQAKGNAKKLPNSKVKVKKKTLSESSSGSDDSSSNSSSSDSETKTPNKKKRTLKNTPCKPVPTSTSRTGPKLSATVYTKQSDESSDSDAPIRQRTSLKDSVNVKVNLKDESQNVSSAKDDSSAKTVRSGIVTRKKTSPKAKEKKVNNNADKNKGNTKTVVKRPRGRPRTKMAVVKAAVTGEESSCSSQRSGSSHSSSSSDTESDTDSSAALAAAACSLQVINEEDLAAILPEHQPCAAFNDFGPCSENQPQTTHTKAVQENDGSSSEMELQLVNAAIQRATADSSSSENESTSQDLNHPSTTHYASSLLQQFVTQTQILSHTNNMGNPISNTMNQINPSVSSMNCTISSTMNKSGLNDCAIPPTIPGIPQLSSNFLSSEHLQTNDNQPLNSQQTEELSQINKDLAELTSTTDDIEISIPNPPCLDDCVDNDFVAVAVPISNNVADSKNTVSKMETPSKSHFGNSKSEISNACVSESRNVQNKISDVKRKRGRPRKIREELIAEPKLSSSCDNLSDANNIIVNEFCRNNDPPNVSPDSGILSNHNSPTQSPSRRMESVENTIKLLNCKSSIKNNVTKRSSRSKSKSRTETCNRERSVSSEASCKQKNIVESFEKRKCDSQILKPDIKTDRKKTDKLDIAALDRMLYATDRVLYPPRRKVGRPPLNKTNSGKKGPGRPPKNKPIIDSGDSEDEIRTNKGILSEVYAKRKDLSKLVVSMSKKSNKNLTNWRDNQSDFEGPCDEPLDPMWREIDLNPKYKDILSGYKSDHEIKSFKVCSRLIESGYKSDYGFKSGYKSDHCSRSGYKSDHKSGYKSDKSGYKSDYSIRNIRRKMRKLKKSRSVRDRNYYKNQKYFVSDQEIILLANKTLSCLTLGHTTSDSDSECRSQNSYLPSKFTNSKNNITSSKFTFGGELTSHLNPPSLSSLNTIDLFAPAPVFSTFGSRLSSNMLNFNIFNTSNRFNFNKTNKHSFGSMFPNNLSVFTHKFACPPISTSRNDTFSSSSFGRDVPNNNNSLKQSCRNTSPKTKKSVKSTDSIYPIFKKEKSPLPVTNLFQQSQSTYVPSKSLSRNIFLNFKKPPKKNSSTPHWKKHKTQFIISPAKSPNPKNNGRLSRMSSKSSVDSRHHRHKFKKHKRQRRSRSASRSREICTKSVSGALDQKFSQEMESLISHFVKLCHSAPKSVSQQSLKSCNDKIVPENILKCIKRTSKKRKGPDSAEIATPTSKRRHKKQLLESQSKGSKDKDTSTNEHKLPLKKRHYHINSSTNNTLSLSLVATEFVENLKTENSKGSETFVCTETNCLGDLNEDNADSPKSSVKTSNSSEKNKKDLSNCKIQDSSINSTQPDLNKSQNSALSVNIDESVESCNSQHVSPCSTGTDDELNIQKPVGEHSEFSKKIYETSEKLKAVHKMVHDLEKSLPKTKESELPSKDTKNESGKALSQKSDNKNSVNTLLSNSNGTKHVAPIVTPKKRHRLEADRLANSSLDLVVQSLSKKLSEDRLSLNDRSNLDESTKIQAKIADSQSNKSNDESVNIKITSLTDTKKDEFSIPHSDSSKSSKVSNKHLPPPAQKSEIITRKKNRLEGLTSNLVSKINPTSASKVLDSLMSNNLRKSIESRIVERNKCGTSNSGDKLIDNLTRDTVSRATVIKSPISKLKLPAEAKKLPKGTDILIEETVVVNVEKPTGIFEPSVDIELQIPKSSISLNHVSVDSSSRYSKSSFRNADAKINGKIVKNNLEGENQISTSCNSPILSDNKSKKFDSIISVISDKIESGHNLRQSKRNQPNDVDPKATGECGSDKKKKKSSNILKESKFKLMPKLIQSKVQCEVPADITNSEIQCNESVNENVVMKNVENMPVTHVSDSSMPLKKRAKRRKAINRTGFPSAKKKKKKMNILSPSNDDILSDTNSLGLSDNNLKVNSAFERVPKVGEATVSFLERTVRKKHGELKIVLNKDECPKQGRVSVVSLEKLQGKINENVPTAKTAVTSQVHTQIEITGSSLNYIEKSNPSPNIQPEILDTVAKWEVLSETDSLPPLSTSSIGNDPEDSIPLSLLNLKAERPNSRIDMKGEKLKRKIREISPCDSIDNVILSKRSVSKSKSKNSLLASDNSNLPKKSTKNSETFLDVDDDIPLSTKRSKLKSTSSKDSHKTIVQNFIKDVSPSESVENDLEIQKDVCRISSRRKSRSCNTVKRLRDVSPSSRDSSLETVKTIKKSPKSRDASVETVKHLQDNCLENDPLPLQEKEIDFEKSIDILSKSIISKKRIMSSRDDSPASSVERGYRSERERSYSTNRNPRMRKKYLAAGLFSNYYKENDPKPVEHKARLVYNAADHPNGLLAPPPYCERWVRQRKIHFSLPYDIWWQHQYNQPVPSWNYRKIRTNVYYDVKPTPDGCESQACNCQPSYECQDDCINRLVYAECSPQLCPCKELCKNQRIQRHEWAPGLDKFMTENKGWGVRTKLSINNGTFILEYVGEVVSDKEFKDRMATRYVKDTHHYCLNLDGGLVIDGHRMGGEGRFVNHSCQPNCEMQKWSVNGLFRMALFALRDIRPGEELTYDYNFSLFNPAEGQPCKCDSENCRGVIGGKSQRITKQIVKAQLKSTAPIIVNPPSSTQTQNVPPSTPNRVGRPRKAVKANIKPNSQSSGSFSPDKNDAALFLKEVQSINLTSRFWQEPQMKPLTAKEKAMVKDRHCFLHRNLDKVKRVRERLLSHPVLAATQQIVSCVQQNAFQISPNSLLGLASANPSALTLPQNVVTNPQAISNPSVFLTRLHALRAPRNIKTRRLAQVEDNPILSKQARLANVFRELYNVVINAKDERNEIICTPLLKKKAAKNSEALVLTIDLSTIESNIETGHYKNVNVFDSHFNSFFAGITKTCGRTSTFGTIALQLKKIYNNIKIDFAEQLMEILGPQEPLPQGFLQKRKQEEVIMCVCGLHFEEGLMVQCGGEGDQQSGNSSSFAQFESTAKTFDDDDANSNDTLKSNSKSTIATSKDPQKDSSNDGSYVGNYSKAVKGCGVWQHARCMAVTDIGEPYYCHRCHPRQVNLEIPLDEYTDDGHQFYLSLMRGDLQVRQGDTVYVLRDIPIDEKNPDCSEQTYEPYVPDSRENNNVSIKGKRLERSKKGRTVCDKDKGSKDKNRKNDSGDPTAKDSADSNKDNVRKHTYKTIGAISVTELDIFRVERLWRDSTTGQRFVYGHHYLRPHETYHEPTRKFFPNEVMRVPLYEAVPIELVMSQCWVMDLNTYCKGRPLAANEEHVYICELRVDKYARLFTKISKPKYPICTKSYAFEMFPQRLKITRTYAPHEVSPSLLKNRTRKQDGNPPGREGKINQEKTIIPQYPALPAPKPKGAPLLHTPIVKNRATQKTRLNGILLKLLSKMPTKQPLDMSYLLDGRRQRKKMISS